jgi:hypothetical protein
MHESFPADIRKFVAEYVKSVAQLEMILLLRSGADRSWAASEVGQALYTSPEMAAAQLRDLHSRGILVQTDQPPERFQYGPAEPLDQQIQKLAELYKERRVSVITLIYSEPADNIRTFADAFRLRKDT